jgi:Tfp pilus assembly protein PilE
VQRGIHAIRFVVVVVVVVVVQIVAATAYQ